MTKINKMVKLFAECMNCDLNNIEKEFSVRLDLQKKFYLLQEICGYDLGFKYGWYLRGPYCSEVADAGFYIAKHNEEFKHLSMKLKDQVRIEVQKVFHEYHKNKPNDLSEESWLELIASLHYIKKYLGLGNAREAAITKLMEKKDWYSKRTVEKAYDLIKE